MRSLSDARKESVDSCGGAVEFTESAGPSEDAL